MSPEETRKQKIIDYRVTFGSESGKRVLDSLAHYCGYDHTTFAPDSPYRTAYLCGLRDVFLHIQNVLKQEVKQESEQENG